MSTRLHRLSEPKGNSVADLIFVHGIGGDHIETWRAEGAPDTWLNWMDSDLSWANVFSIEYESSPSKWLGSEAMPIFDRATNLLELLSSDGNIGAKPIVFIAHSLGGLIVKRMLENAIGIGTAEHKAILQQTRGAVFLATPHQGSAIVPSLSVLRQFFRITKMSAELQSNETQLRESYYWYRENVQRLDIQTQAFRETIETAYGLVVDAASADPGITGVITTPIHADHFSICKPKDRDEPVYKSVVRFAAKCISEFLPPEKSPAPSRNFSDVKSFDAVVSALQDSFYFRWELSTYDLGHQSPLIYWPVRLRYPTPIHAAQCFAAAGLQKRGAEINLFIDDLGEKNYEIDSFIDKLLSWLEMVGGSRDSVSTILFSQVIPPTENGIGSEADPWITVRKWLGDTGYRLDQIFQVAKLVPSSGTFTLKELTDKRPRRLLTPALVWTCLSFLSSQKPDRPIVTLGGRDEQPLWDAWKDRSIRPEAKVGHLYGPELNEVDNQHGSSPIHMARPRNYSLEWRSKDDIRTAVQTEANSEGWSQFGRLIPWSTRCCIFLPLFISDEAVVLKAGATDLDLNLPLENIPTNQLSPVLIDELARWLI